MEKFYSFAGVDVVVDIPEEKMYPDERMLAPFAVEAVTNPHRFHFEFVDSLQPPAGECIAKLPEFLVYAEADRTVRYIGSVNRSWDGAYIRATHAGREHHIQLLSSTFPGQVGVKTVLTALAAEHLIACNGGFVFHCSCIERNGKAILFTAPSGTGKSTQADQWHQLRGTPIVNGDRAAVRVTGEGVFACGIPFSGSSVYCENRTLPLEAIVYLAQAPVTSIRKLRGYEAFRRVWEGCSINTWEPEDMRQVSDAVTQTVSAVPVFYLPCTPDESAVTALEQALEK